MGFIASFFSGLKAEVEWLITSLAVAPATNESAAAQDGAPAGAAAHHDDSTPATHSAVLAVADHQTDNAPAADATPAQHAGADDAPAWTAQDVSYILPHADNLAIPADVTPDAPAPTPYAPLTPLSLTDNFSASDVLTAADASPHGYQNVSLPSAPAQDHAESHWTLPNSGAGDFALASLVPFMKGGGNAQHGGGGGGSPYLIYDTVQAGTANHDATLSSSGLDITLSFDASVANAPKMDQNGSNTYGFVQDLEDVANFFARNFSHSNAHITIHVGYGEINGAHVSSSVLGESETYYIGIQPGSGQTQYQALQAAYAAHASVTLPANDPFSGSQTLEVEPAQGKALGFANTASYNPDGWIGFGNGSGLFFYNPGSPVSGENDFMGTAAHEVSEIMGRETWNGTKSGGAMQFLPMDFFHFADSNGAPIYSGTTAGHFSLSQGGAVLEEYNTSSAGDYSDWATGSSFPVDSFDWAGGASGDAPVSYADYLVMEAVGYAGSYTGGAANWNSQNWWTIGS